MRGGAGSSSTRLASVCGGPKIRPRVRVKIGLGLVCVCVCGGGTLVVVGREGGGRGSDSTGLARVRVRVAPLRRALGHAALDVAALERGLELLERLARGRGRGRVRG